MTYDKCNSKICCLYEEKSSGHRQMPSYHGFSMEVNDCAAWSCSMWEGTQFLECANVDPISHPFLEHAKVWDVSQLPRTCFSSMLKVNSQNICEKRTINITPVDFGNLGLGFWELTTVYS